MVRIQNGKTLLELTACPYPILKILVMMHQVVVAVLKSGFNDLSGMVAQYQLALALRSRQRFALTEFCQGVRDATVLTITQVQQRVLRQRDDGKGLELDMVAH